MKICSRCGINKPKGEFGKRKGVKDGLQSWCKACANKATKKCKTTPEGKESQRKAVKRYQVQRRAEYKGFIDGLKVQVGCSVCGLNDDPEKLDYHHTDPNTKLFGITRGVSAHSSSYN